MNQSSTRNDEKIVYKRKNIFVVKHYIDDSTKLGLGLGLGLSFGLLLIAFLYYRYSNKSFLTKEQRERGRQYRESISGQSGSLFDKVWFEVFSKKLAKL